MKPIDCTSATETLFKILADIGSAFSSAARLKILQLLSQAPRSVDAISEITGETVGNTSQHLQRLLRSGLVGVQKEGLSRIYRLKDDQVAMMVEGLFDLAEHFSVEFQKAEREITDEDYVSPCGMDEVLRHVRANKATLIDVRDQVESEGSPVEGAMTIPAKQLKQKASTLPKGKTYFIFCRGRACALASEGVRVLRSLGFTAYRLKESPTAIRRRTK